MQITLISVAVETKPTASGRSYKEAKLVYRQAGKDEAYTKTLVSFKNPSVFNDISKATPGTEYEVETVKNSATGYTDWTRATRLGTSTAGELPAVNASGAGAKAPVRMPVTEHDRNRYIVRQSSLERAVEILTGQTTPITFEAVTALAGRLEQWVFRPIQVAAEAVAVPAPIVEGAAKPRGRPRKVVVVDQQTEEVVEAEVE